MYKNQDQGEKNGKLEGKNIPYKSGIFTVFRKKQIFNTVQNNGQKPVL
jgi:hypothetical protein